MKSLIAWLRTRRIRRAEREAEYWRVEARRCGLLAHSIDPIQEPLRWGQLQNRANWAKYNERAAIKKALP